MRRLIAAVFIFCGVLAYPVGSRLASSTFSLEEFTFDVAFIALLLAVWATAGGYETDDRHKEVRAAITLMGYDIRRLGREIETLREELREAKEDNEPWKS